MILCFGLLVESEIIFDRVGLIVEFRNVSISRSLSREVDGVRPVEGDEPEIFLVIYQRKRMAYIVIILYKTY